TPRWDRQRFYAFIATRTSVSASRVRLKQLSSRFVIDGPAQTGVSVIEVTRTHALGRETPFSPSRRGQSAMTPEPLRCRGGKWMSALRPSPDGAEALTVWDVERPSTAGAGEWNGPDRDFGKRERLEKRAGEG